MLWQRGVLLQRLVRIESGIKLNRYNRKDVLTPGRALLRRVLERFALGH
jgi:hypothetical protein